MSRRRSFRIFGSPPFRLFADHLIQDDDFLDDARRVIALSNEQFEQLAGILESLDQFIDRDLLTRTVERVLGATEDSKEIARTIRRLATMLRDSDEPLEQAASILKTAITERFDKLELDERQTLAERLERLAVNPPGFSKQHKAQQLAEATGREIEDIQIICDIRPVFNEDRTVIEGGIPVTTFHLEFADAGSDSPLEIRLNEEQLNELCDKTQAAIRKLTAIKALLEEKEISVPQTSATRHQSGDTE